MFHSCNPAPRGNWDLSTVALGICDGYDWNTIMPSYPRIKLQMQVCKTKLHLMFLIFGLGIGMSPGSLSGDLI